MSFNAACVGQYLSVNTLCGSKLPYVNSNRIRCRRSEYENPNKPRKNRQCISMKNVSIAAVSGFVGFVSSYEGYKKVPQIGIGGGATGGGGDGGGGGGGGYGGSFWKRLMSPADDQVDENQPGEWDKHGVAAGLVLPLWRLKGSKRYKVSAIDLYDVVTKKVVGSENPFSELVSLKAGGVYTKAQLEKELETIDCGGVFEKVDLEAKTEVDGTIAVTLTFEEFCWGKASSFRCLNVGLMPPLIAFHVEDDMPFKKQVARVRSHENYYRGRMEKARPCMLPNAVEMEIVEILQVEDVRPQVLRNIRDRVQNWYHDEGYAGAQVVNFENVLTDEVVCEVVEGDITKVVIQMEDKDGNACERKNLIQVVEKQLPEELREGHAFNIKAGKDALSKIESLSLFSEMEISPKHDDDENPEGGVVVEIKLKE